MFKPSFYLLSFVSLVGGYACTRDNTDHPQHGRITSLTTDWTERGEGIEPPASYTVSAGDYSTTLSGATNSIDNLFAPGHYTLRAHNTADGITVNGHLAKADYTAPGGIGWFFAGSERITIERDRDHTALIKLRQMVKGLTLSLEVTGDARNRLTSIEGTLSGAAGAINIETGEPTGSRATVPLTFALKDGKFTTSTRLAGVCDGPKTLTLKLRFEDGNPAEYTATSDLSQKLASFNSDKTTPLTLTSVLVATPTEAGFSTRVTDWAHGGNSSGVAD